MPVSNVHEVTMKKNAPSFQPLSLEKRRLFLKLSIEKRRRFLIEQSEELAYYYEQNKEWREMGSGEFLEH